MLWLAVGGRGRKDLDDHIILVEDVAYGGPLCSLRVELPHDALVLEAGHVVRQRPALAQQRPPGVLEADAVAASRVAGRALLFRILDARRYHVGDQWEGEGLLNDQHMCIGKVDLKHNSLGASFLVPPLLVVVVAAVGAI